MKYAKIGITIVWLIKLGDFLRYAESLFQRDTSLKK